MDGRCRFAEVGQQLDGLRGATCLYEVIDRQLVPIVSFFQVFAIAPIVRYCTIASAVLPPAFA